MTSIRAVVASLTLLVCAGACTTGATGQPQPTPSTQRPDVVFVLTDDLSMNLVPYLPHVLALEKAGTTFTNYTVTDSLCCPSRSSIFSGRFPHDTGVYTNTGPDCGFNVFHSRGEESDTSATALRQTGYRTGMMGKYFNG
jgi:N-acetylglucosamine-6-sulfatase